MTGQNLSKFLNKGISAPIGILIVLILASLVSGGILWWTKTQEVPSAEFPEIKKPEKPPQGEPSDAKDCKTKFISWCENCRSLSWPTGSDNSPVLSVETNSCLNKYLNITFPKTTYCDNAKQTCKDFGVIETIKDETTDWRAYKNEEYGLEMRYPPEAKVLEENTKAEPATVDFYYLDNNEYSSGVFVIRRMNYDKIGQKVSLEEIQGEILPVFLGGEIKEQIEKQTLVDNIPAVEFSWFDREEKQFYKVSAAIVNKYIFIIGCFSEQNWCKNNFYSILSTVQFEEKIKISKCNSLKDCGICQMCGVGGFCVDISTNWGDGLYGCPAGYGLEKQRCYKGVCRTCDGLLLFDSGAKKYGCWYLGTSATTCREFCGKKGCVESHWEDDEMCTIGKTLTNCTNCSTDYEDGWWVPYYDITKNICYRNSGTGNYYTCSGWPDLASLRRMCVCNY